MTITGASGSNMTISAYDATHYSVSGTDGSTSFGPTQYLW
jgi:hypothetical protein